MLRHLHQDKQVLKYLLKIAQQQEHRLIHQHNSILCNKITGNALRQGKIMGKLFNYRVSGSKKRWFPSSTDPMQTANSNVLIKQTQFGKSVSKGGKNDTRRMNVLNKLFMGHITDLMATGEISERILGKGLQISRVKVSQDFAYANVYWVSTGDMDKDSKLEHELQSCGGLLRHELSQLQLIGVIPRINFVKDKQFSNGKQVEALLKNIDFGEEEEEELEGGANGFDKRFRAKSLQEEFYGRISNNTTLPKPQDISVNDNSIEILTDNVPEMRHDVLGLDHKAIMLKIFTKMRKSKQAWEQHLNNIPSDLADQTISSSTTTVPSTSYSQLSKINEKLAKVAENSDKFEAFLAQRKQKRNTPERKKFRASEHCIDDINNNKDNDDHTELIMSKQQRQMFEAEDYFPDETDDINHK